MRQYFGSSQFKSFIFQSTHSRGVRRYIQDKYGLTEAISIHALTRSATIVNEHCHCSFSISIHALTRSATGRLIDIWSNLYNFNPRTREECDNPDCLRDLLLLVISIHALARSATFTSYKFVIVIIKFQSTHSRGVRPTRNGGGFPLCVFQSTHSRGVRPVFFSDNGDAAKFQSTHSRGVRHSIDYSKKDRVIISIHALARSATDI